SSPARDGAQPAAHGRHADQRPAQAAHGYIERGERHHRHEHLRLRARPHGARRPSRQHARPRPVRPAGRRRFLAPGPTAQVPAGPGCAPGQDRHAVQSFLRAPSHARTVIPRASSAPLSTAIPKVPFCKHFPTHIVLAYPPQCAYIPTNLAGKMVGTLRHTLHRLKPLTLRSATAPGYVGDGGGLSLQITTSGARSWIFRYSLGGQRREMGLGPFSRARTNDPPPVNLATARKLAAEKRALVAE